MPQIIQILRSLEAKKRPDPATLLQGQLAANIDPTEPSLYFADSEGNLRKVGPCHIGSEPPKLQRSTTSIPGKLHRRDVV